MQKLKNKVIPCTCPDGEPETVKVIINSTIYTVCKRCYKCDLRTCLKCRYYFPSKHKTNRICPRCTNTVSGGLDPTYAISDTCIRQGQFRRTRKAGNSDS